jgi:2,4-dienoyl-CoA reductase (NADPH2)
MNLSGNPFSSLQALQSLIRKMECQVSFLEDVTPLKTPLMAGGLSFPNRVAVQPMEGADATSEGEPTSFTEERYKGFAEGGAGLIWFEACSVDFPEARSHDAMLIISDKTVPKFKSMVKEVKKASEASLSSLGMDGRAVLVLQLGHAGRYRVEKSDRSPAVGYRFPKLDKNIGITDEMGRIVSDDELRELQGAFIDAARLAVEAGFDAVDVKACHGYLLNSLLSGFTRGGDYGGEEYGKRSRFILETISSIRKEVGCAVTSRFSAYDGHPYPYGFGSLKKRGEPELPGERLPLIDLSEPIQLARDLRSAGVDFVNVSLGDPYYGAFVTRPFDVKPPGARDPSEHPLKGVDRHFMIVEELKKEVPDMVYVGSGYSWLRQYSIQAASYNVANNRTDIAGWGRLALACPAFPRTAFTTGSLPSYKACVTCSRCTRLLRAGVRSGCVTQNPLAFKESMLRLQEMGK